MKKTERSRRPARNERHLRCAIAMAATSALLGACAGGASLGLTPPPAAPAASVSTILSAAPPPAYASGSEEAKAFALLNAERIRCGFGALTQNPRLDEAARGHANYLLHNNQTGHHEEPGRPGFIGSSVLDRAIAKGYQPALIHDLNTDMFGASDFTGRGEFAVRSLLSGPYHLSGLTTAGRDVGIAVRSSDQAGSTAAYGKRTVEQFNIAYQAAAGPQLPSPSEVRTYPCAGTSGVFYEGTPEAPNPIPGRNLRAQPFGQPVLVSLRPDQKLAITLAAMAEGGQGGPGVALRPAMGKDNDPNRMLGAHEAAILPDAALKKNTTYHVRIEGTSDGVRFARAFSFTTGATSGL